MDPEAAARRAEAKERERAEAEAARAAARAAAAAREAAAREAQRVATRERKDAERLRAVREKEDKEAAARAAAERAARRAAAKQNRAAKAAASARDAGRRKRGATVAGAVGGAADAVVATGGVLAAVVRVIVAASAASLTVSAELARIPVRLAIGRIAGEDAAATALRRPRGVWVGVVFDILTLLAAAVAARLAIAGGWKGTRLAWTWAGVPAVRWLGVALRAAGHGGRRAAATALVRPVVVCWTHLVWRPRWWMVALEVVALCECVECVECLCVACGDVHGCLFCISHLPSPPSTVLSQFSLPSPVSIVAATLLTHPVAWWLAPRFAGQGVTLASIAAFAAVVAFHPGPPSSLVAAASDVAFATPVALGAVVASWRAVSLPVLSRLGLKALSIGLWWAWVRGGGGRRTRARARFPSTVGGGRHLADEAVDGAPEEVARVLRAADHYEVLGVARGMSDGEIKKAWRLLARRVHPDKLGPGVPGADRAMGRVSEAYEKLATAEARAAYDDELAAAAAEAEAEAATAAAPSDFAAAPTGDAPIALDCECGRTHKLKPVTRGAPLASCTACDTAHTPQPGDIWCERAAAAPGARRARRAYYMHAGNAVYDITAAVECDQSRLASAGNIRRGECVLERRAGGG